MEKWRGVDTPLCMATRGKWHVIYFWVGVPYDFRRGGIPNGSDPLDPSSYAILGSARCLAVQLQLHIHAVLVCWERKMARRYCCLIMIIFLQCLIVQSDLVSQHSVITVKSFAVPSFRCCRSQIGSMTIFDLKMSVPIDPDTDSITSGHLSLTTCGLWNIIVRVKSCIWSSLNACSNL